MSRLITTVRTTTGRSRRVEAEPVTQVEVDPIPEKLKYACTLGWSMEIDVKPLTEEGLSKARVILVNNHTRTHSSGICAVYDTAKL